MNLFLTPSPPDDAINRALKARKNGYVIINEISSNPGSGCPGDGIYLLHALLKWNLPNTVFQFITDRQDALITADPPGLRCSDLSTSPFKRICRPIYSVDQNCEFKL